MPVSKDTILDSPLAQKYLQANPEEILGMCAEVEERIGTDTVTPLELESMAADLRNWQEAFENIPATEVGSASYRVAEKCLEIIKRNYIALYFKNAAARAVRPEPDPEMEKIFRVIGDGWRNLVSNPD